MRFFKKGSAFFALGIEADSPQPDHRSCEDLGLVTDSPTLVVTPNFSVHPKENLGHSKRLYSIKPSLLYSWYRKLLYGKRVTCISRTSS